MLGIVDAGNRAVDIVEARRARELARRGDIPDRHAQRWGTEAQAIQAFVEARCFSPEKGSYVRCADSDELDASLLLGVLFAAEWGDLSQLLTISLEELKVAAESGELRKLKGFGPKTEQRLLADDAELQPRSRSDLQAEMCAAAVRQGDSRAAVEAIRAIRALEEGSRSRNMRRGWNVHAGS